MLINTSSPLEQSHPAILKVTQFLSCPPVTAPGVVALGRVDAGDGMADENATSPAKAGAVATHAVPWMKLLRPILMLLLRLSLKAYLLARAFDTGVTV